MSSKEMTQDAPKTLRLVEPLGAGDPSVSLPEDLENRKVNK